jgi:hypothetical protein
MALASWSTKRMAALWAVGLVLEALLLLAPVIIFHDMFGSVADFRRVVAEQDARARTSALADSISLARQKDDARANRTYSITPAGDTVFALVHMPLDQVAPVSPAVERARVRRSGYTSLIVLGFIPTVLVVITLCWVDARRA